MSDHASIVPLRADWHVPSDPHQLEENIIDLEMAIADATARLDPSDPIAAAELADLSAAYHAHLAARRLVTTR